jgi:hypothetical protein
MKNRLKISLLITKLSISQPIYIRYDTIRNISFNLIKVNYNHQRCAKRFKVFFIREASHIDLVHEKRHMFVSLETPPPPFRNVTHSYRYFVLHSTRHKVIFYYFLRSAIGDASARNMSSSADISFFINI